MKIGIFGFGGGYGMLSMIQHDVVDQYAWMSAPEFTDLVAISQMTPGPISINCATFVGYTASGNVAGALLASLALCLPSIAMIWILVKAFDRYAQQTLVKSVISALSPITVTLIASASVTLMNTQTFVDFKALAIGITSFALAFFAKINPIWLLMGSGFAGYWLWA